jgi:electron transport complex protein RnfB
MPTVKEIDALLPQTQCGECGYPGCLPYAEAIASKAADINLCPPGGTSTLKALGQLLDREVSPYLEEARKNTRPPSVAVIREAECIGCTKCIQACPVDAIIGSAKLMHAVLSQECTGCGLCVEPCPVDCIEMVNTPEINYDPNLARTRFQAKQTRHLREAHEQQQKYREKRQLVQQAQSQGPDVQAKQQYIQQALARVAAKKK